MKCRICQTEMIPEEVNCGGDCVVCMADIGEDPECKKIVGYHRGEPDHDAEVLGFPNGEAPTMSSKIWKYINVIRKQK